MSSSKVLPGEKDYRKHCTICNTPRDVLIRCQIDASGKWHFLCPGECWTRVSGGVVDGDGAAEHRHYRYGGMWKNKHEAVSAKMPRKVKEEQRRKGERSKDEAVTGEEINVEEATGADDQERDGEDIT